MQISLGHWIRVLIVFVLVAITSFFVRTHVAGGQGFAQDFGTDVTQGRKLADAWCMECHALERQRRVVRPGPSAPDFSAIANRRGTTELSIKTFLRSEHDTMPHYVIGPGDADILAAYILSFRR